MSGFARKCFAHFNTVSYYNGIEMYG